MQKIYKILFLSTIAILLLTYFLLAVFSSQKQLPKQLEQPIIQNQQQIEQLEVQSSNSKKIEEEKDVEIEEFLQEKESQNQVEEERQKENEVKIEEEKEKENYEEINILESQQESRNEQEGILNKLYQMDFWNMKQYIAQKFPDGNETIKSPIEILRNFEQINECVQLEPSQI